MTITLNGTTGIITPAVQAEGVTTNIYPIVSGTAVASTSGTFIDFTSVPSWVKRITVMFSGLSTNSTSGLIVQLGAGSITTSGYNGACSTTAGSQNPFSTTVGFLVNNNMDAANARSGSVILTYLGSNIWTEIGNIFPNAGGTLGCISGGQVTLSGTLDRIRITTQNGTDVFDAGTVNILYE